MLWSPQAVSQGCLPGLTEFPKRPTSYLAFPTFHTSLRSFLLNLASQCCLILILKGQALSPKSLLPAGHCRGSAWILPAGSLATSHPPLQSVSQICKAHTHRHIPTIASRVLPGWCLARDGLVTLRMSEMPFVSAGLPQWPAEKPGWRVSQGPGRSNTEPDRARQV